MRVIAIKDYRCGEPNKAKVPPPAIEKLMISLLGRHGRIHKGGVYSMPGELAKVLLKDGAVKEE